jgi:hypothetical protein
MWHVALVARYEAGRALVAGSVACGRSLHYALLRLCYGSIKLLLRLVMSELDGRNRALTEP